MCKVAMHQSQYIPWPPYFKKIASADIFVLMDNVQFQKNGVQNRNKIRNNQGAFWLTIPVTGRLEDRIMNRRIASSNWQEKHWKSLNAAYAKAPFWDLYMNDLERLYYKKYSTLGEVNHEFFNYLIRCFDIQTKIVYLSELKINVLKSDLVLEICKIFEAKVYISGLGGKQYLKEDDFRKNGIRIEYQESMPPTYRQFHRDFIQGLSAIDMLFNVDIKSINKYLKEVQ